mmetsp:Transcript_56601/g.104769  ORF Transcript_56601/g.104769 Transcript_56601/m.104769 type:complete len:222 (+) Transcript_56601:89-754(+)
MFALRWLVLMVHAMQGVALQSLPQRSADGSAAESICDAHVHSVANHAACMESVLSNDYDCARYCKDPGNGISACSALDSKICHSSCLSRRLFENSATLEAQEAFWKDALEATAAKFNWTATVLANITVPNRTEAFQGFWDSLCERKSSSVCLQDTSNSSASQAFLWQTGMHRAQGFLESQELRPALVSVAKAFRTWIQDTRLPAMMLLVARCNMGNHTPRG